MSYSGMGAVLLAPQTKPVEPKPQVMLTATAAKALLPKPPPFDMAKAMAHMKKMTSGGSIPNPNESLIPISESAAPRLTDKSLLPWLLLGVGAIVISGVLFVGSMAMSRKATSNRSRRRRRMYRRNDGCSREIQSARKRIHDLRHELDICERTVRKSIRP